jgi:hypothetical protein
VGDLLEVASCSRIWASIDSTSIFYFHDICKLYNESISICQVMCLVLTDVFTLVNFLVKNLELKVANPPQGLWGSCFGHSYGLGEGGRCHPHGFWG